MAYRCVALSIEAFVYRVAVYYVARGYSLYSMGYVPDGKDPVEVDHKLIEKYDIDLTARQRAYRKSLRRANVHYVRFGRVYVLLATPGRHKNFFNGLYDAHGTLLPAHLRGELAVLRDAEKTPIVIGDYSISATPRGVSVRIRQEVARVLCAHFRELATKRRQASDLEAELRREWDYLMFTPIQFQLKTLISGINQKRRRKKLEPISASWVRRYPTPAPHSLAA